MLKPVRTVAPAVNPVTLDEVKAQVRVDFPDHDALLQGLIDAAVSHLDGYGGALGRAMITQTWRQDFKEFDDRVRLALGDVLSVTSVQYYDLNNVLQTASASLYGVYTDAVGPYVEINSNQSWPSTYDRPDAVRVTWTCGFGPAAADVPAALRHAILMMVAHWYANREATVTGVTAVELPFAVGALVGPLTVKKV